MKSIVECNICFKQGDGYWAGQHKIDTGHEWFDMVVEDEPPSESNSDSFKLCLFGSRDLYSTLFGCQPLLAGNNSFRSLAWFSDHR